MKIGGRVDPARVKARVEKEVGAGGNRDAPRHQGSGQNSTQHPVVPNVFTSVSTHCHEVPAGYVPLRVGALGIVISAGFLVPLSVARMATDHVQL